MTRRTTALLASAVAVACLGGAGTAQADTPATDSSSYAKADNIKAVVVLIGANNYGFADPVASRPPN